MKKVSRRKFVIGASAGAVVVGAGVGVSAIASAQGPSQQKAAQFASTLQTPLTVYVRDAAKGEIVLLANNNQVIIQDKDLAARLLNAAQ
jgi:hypothetical protein